MDENVEYEEKENEFDIVSICFAASLIAKHELWLLFFSLKVDWWELSSVYRVPFMYAIKFCKKNDFGVKSGKYNGCKGRKVLIEPRRDTRGWAECWF